MSVTTRVRLVVEIGTDSTWSDETTVAQIKKQSLDSAYKTIRKALEGKSVKIIEDMQCLTMIMDER